MYQAAVHQNVLCAVPHPHTATGYKDRKDPCHRKASKAYQRRATAHTAPACACALLCDAPVTSIGTPLQATDRPPAALCAVAR